MQRTSSAPSIVFCFSVSRSSNFKRAVKLAKTIPGYRLVDEVHTVQIDGWVEYIRNFRKLENLLSVAGNWKSAKLYCEGEIFEYRRFYEYQRALYECAGNYAPFLRQSDVADDAMTIEDLPSPVVYYPGLYGAFFAFAEQIDSKPCFCECQRPAIENYIDLKIVSGIGYFPKTLSIESWKGSAWRDFLRFKPGLCFRCNHLLPALDYCHEMYGTRFLRKFGWYVNDKFFQLGINPYQIRLPKSRIGPPQIYDAITHLLQLKGPVLSEEEQAIRALYHKELKDSIENLVREENGYPKIGEAWVSESRLFHIIEQIFPGQAVLRHHRPKWLVGLELDTFLPDLQLAFEYQGIQHFEPVEHWGGAAKLLIQQQHDRKKAELCKAKGVTLIPVSYGEELSVDHIKSKIPCRYINP